MTLPAHAHTVIVGAGAAGCVMARRISEHDATDVLLLDAGPDYPDPAALPADLADGGQNSMRAHDWGFKHRPTTVQVRFPFPRGRVVGGSSAVNTCIALRGQPYDYDEWGARGLKDWSWEQCLPAFRRLEHDLDRADPWHGQDGPLPIRRDPPSTWVRWQQAFVQTCEDLGFPRSDDTNAPDAHGVGPHAFNRIDGRRISAAEAYLTPEVRARPNLHITPGAHVVAVRVDGDRATGVDLLHEGALKTVTADRVVLAAGAILTPAILLRSGIGPRDRLAALAVDVVRTLPAVGAQLLDHPGYAMFLSPKRGTSRRDDTILQTVLRYQDDVDDRPGNLQMQPGSRAIFPWFPAPPLVTIMGHIGKPKGVGALHIVSRDPHAKPKIDSAMLEHPEDRKRAAEAMQLAHRITQHPRMAALARPLWPRPRTLRDLERTMGWIRRATDSGYHPCGTVPMGSDDDPNAAADGRGRLRGFENLYVGDASLMPTVPSSNIHLPTLMIGERIGAWLRDDPSA